MLASSGGSRERAAGGGSGSAACLPLVLLVLHNSIIDPCALECEADPAWPCSFEPHRSHSSMGAQHNSSRSWMPGWPGMAA